MVGPAVGAADMCVLRFGLRVLPLPETDCSSTRTMKDNPAVRSFTGHRRCRLMQIGVQYASRQAWVDFLRDANQMGKLRHGNLCEVRADTSACRALLQHAQPRCRAVHVLCAGPMRSCSGTRACGWAARAPSQPSLGTLLLSVLTNGHRGRCLPPASWQPGRPADLAPLPLPMPYPASFAGVWRCAAPRLRPPPGSPSVQKRASCTRNRLRRRRCHPACNNRCGAGAAAAAAGHGPAVASGWACAAGQRSAPLGGCQAGAARGDAAAGGIHAAAAVAGAGGQPAGHCDGVCGGALAGVSRQGSAGPSGSSGTSSGLFACAAGVAPPAACRGALTVGRDGPRQAPGF